jgi:hypothetical protein
MDVAIFLSLLHSELEQVEQEIRVLEREAGTRCEFGYEPGLSAAELEPFRKSTRGSDRMYRLQ